MDAMLVCSILLAVSYIGAAIWKERCIPESISSIVYVFGERWLWTVWLWAVSFLTTIPAIDVLSRIGMELLGFGTLACLVFCGGLPIIDKENTTAHWVSGVAGCILSQLCVWFISYESMWVWMAFPFLFLSSYVQPDGWLGRMMKGKGVFLAEVICYVTLVGSMLA